MGKDPPPRSPNRSTPRCVSGPGANRSAAFRRRLRGKGYAAGTHLVRVLRPGRAGEPRFGEQRILPARSSLAERTLFRIMGVADPAHYLHFAYLRSALDSLGDFAPGDILDAGCGRGDYAIYLARRYPRAAVLGIDIDEGLIERSRESARLLGLHDVRFEVGDLSRIEYREAFDLVVSIDVLEHIRNQADALACLARAVRPGGVAYYHIPTLREKPVPFSRHLKGFHAWAEKEHVAEVHTFRSFSSAVHASGLLVVEGKRTFGYYTGELGTSLFALPYSNTLRNRILQGLLAPICRGLAWADRLGLERTRYAVGVLATK